MVWAGSVKTFRNVGDVTNDTADLTTKGNLRVKRRDPWHGANALPKAVADLVQSGQDAEKKSQTCLDLVREPVAQPSAQTSSKASLDNSALPQKRKTERPCYEAEDSACRGE